MRHTRPPVWVGTDDDVRTYRGRSAYLMGERWQLLNDLTRRGVGNNSDIDHWSAWEYVADESKRRYEWAEDSFLQGYLPAHHFFEEAQRFQLAAFTAWSERYLREESLLTEEDIAWELRQALKASRRDPVTDRARWMRLATALGENRERKERWQQELSRRQETRQQREFLRQGKTTLTSIRKYIRAAAASPPPESRLARTSQTL